MNYLSEPQQYTATENHLAISDLLLVKLNALFGFLYFDGSPYLIITQRPFFATFKILHNSQLNNRAIQTPVIKIRIVCDTYFWVSAYHVCADSGYRVLCTVLGQPFFVVMMLQCFIIGTTMMMSLI